MSDEIIAIGAVAGAILSIWGVVKAAAAARSYAVKRMRERREVKAAPVRRILLQMDEQSQSLRSITERLETMGETDREIRERIEKIEGRTMSMMNAIATLQGDRLNQAYEYYVDGERPCPMSTKESLSAMCRQYIDGGHNHLHENYIERLMQCPTK